MSPLFLHVQGMMFDSPSKRQTQHDPPEKIIKELCLIYQ